MLPATNSRICNTLLTSLPAVWEVAGELPTLFESISIPKRSLPISPKSLLKTPSAARKAPAAKLFNFDFRFIRARILSSLLLNCVGYHSHDNEGEDDDHDTNYRVDNGFFPRFRGFFIAAGSDVAETAYDQENDSD